jgi:hypothetical protein
VTAGIPQIQLAEALRHRGSLHLLTSLNVQEPRLGECFDPLGDNREAKIMRQDDDGADDRGVLAVIADFFHETLVDLDSCQWISAEIAQ